jgi:hypothetical protein
MNLKGNSMKKKVMLMMFICIEVCFPCPSKANPKYVGERAIVDSASGPSHLSFRFRSQEFKWEAKSLEREEDFSKIHPILLSQSPVKRIYLEKLLTQEGFNEWKERVDRNQPHYRPFLIEMDGIPLAFIELHTMPRAVTDTVSQEEILKYYQEKGLMTHDANNAEEKWTGKYRPLNNGRSSMARMRFMPSTQLLDQPELMADMIAGTSAFISTLSDNNFPMHSYPTDKVQDLPKILMSYTALEEQVRTAYGAAGFTIEENAGFKEFWAEEHHSQLPKPMVVVSKSIETIDPNLINLLPLV